MEKGAYLSQPKRLRLTTKDGAPELLPNQEQIP